VRRPLPSLALLVVTAAVLLPAGAASGLPYPVTSKADGDGKGTLRGSITEANENSGADSIPIEVTGAILLESPLPPIEGDLAITGPGAAALTIKRSVLAGTFRILDFDGGTSSVEGVKIADGEDTLGGGIFNGSGSLTLTRVAVTDNEAKAASLLSGPAQGGGIYSEGPLTLRASVVSGNRAVIKGSAESDPQGGGIFASGSLTIERSTISGNSVVDEGGTDAQPTGGGIFATGSGQLTGVTVTANSAAGGEAAGSNLRLPAGLLVRDTIVANPAGDAESCSGDLDSGGYNLDEDGSCGLAGSSDLANVIAGLDPVLQDNGGPTPTHAMFENSIAIDRGNSFGATTDQRGLPRPSNFPEISDKEGGDGSDIGAFELQAPPPPQSGTLPIFISERPTDRTPPGTRIVSGPPRTTFKRQAQFRFASTEAQSHFRCKLDKKKWKACVNPFKSSVKPGKHLFRVRAIDRFGNVDPTPAQFGWRVKPIAG
jgi:hypothetical protein